MILNLFAVFGGVLTPVFLRARGPSHIILAESNLLRRPNRISLYMDDQAQPRQRLLYLHARTPSVFSDILGYTLIEPVKGFKVEISGGEFEWPYVSVHDAVVDGWQIVQFPHLQSPFSDTELDVLGYEFILQKMEVIP